MPPILSRRKYASYFEQDKVYPLLEKVYPLFLSRRKYAPYFEQENVYPLF